MSILRDRYEKVSGFCRSTDTSSLHKMAVWSDVSPWCSFVEMRMLSLCQADGLGCEQVQKRSDPFYCAESKLGREFGQKNKGEWTRKVQANDIVNYGRNSFFIFI